MKLIRTMSDACFKQRQKHHADTDCGQLSPGANARFR
jgi:hypothetical protein